MIYIFDLDGTLTNTLNSIAYFCNLSLEALGLEPIHDADLFRYMVGDGRDQLIHRMLAYHNADTPENYERAAKVYDEAYEGNFMHLVTHYEGIEQALNTLKEQGHTLCVLSNKPDNMTKAVVYTIFGKDLFTLVYGHRQGIPHKPDPTPARMLIQELHADPADCVFVGDTNVDIKTGKGAGMKTIGVLWGFRDRHELEEAGADYILSDPAQLADTL